MGRATTGAVAIAIAATTGCNGRVEVTGPSDLDAAADGGASSGGESPDGGTTGSSSGGATASSSSGGTTPIPPSDGSGCTPKTCQELGYNCGKNADTCGGIIDCGSCSGTRYCGGGGYSRCGGSTGPPDTGLPCQPKSCADFPVGTCGAQSDGCGGVTGICAVSASGLCPPGQFCGGGGPGLCGLLPVDAGAG